MTTGFFKLRVAFRTVSLALVFGVSLAGCGGGSSSSPAPTSPTFSPTFNMVVKQPFTDTGKLLAVGDKLTITASGSVNNGQCGGLTTCTWTPDGSPWPTCKNDTPAFTAPGLACWSLIGKIGANGTPFEVGSSFVLTAATAGEFFLGVNDNYYPDNTGTWAVSITPA